ncbi:ATP-binding protein [Streptomyces sp. NPDC058548]|uniref:ATP-binding protein n=1 Tax=Streptomyces sp. NPDC058548 TaxID=3346545 RepID=UPI0036461D67
MSEALFPAPVLVVSDDDGFDRARSLPRSPESAAVARRLVRRALATWSLPDLVEGAVLVVTELVANAAVHARGATIQVTVARVAIGQVRVAVIDLDRTEPALRLAADDDERGRGLALVEAVSARWGVDPLRWGKRVWADLEAA